MDIEKRQGCSCVIVWTFFIFAIVTTWVVGRDTDWFATWSVAKVVTFALVNGIVFILLAHIVQRVTGVW